MLSISRLFHRQSHKQLIEKAGTQAEAGRRLAMYDRQTGLLASWYIRGRFNEEAKRAARGDRSLSIVVLRAPKATGFADADQVVTWLSGRIRPYDLATHLGDGEFMVVMPETAAGDAEGLVRRISSAVEGVVAGVSSYPDDALSFDDLTEVARSRLVA
jgi:GGDEF domain-containing protein